MKRIAIASIIGLIFVFPFSGFAQKAALLRANEYFSNLDYAKAISEYLEIYSNDSLNLYLTKKIAESYYLMSDYNLSLPYYQKLIESKKYDQEDVFRYAQLLEISGKKEEANEYYKKYAILNPDDKRVQMELRSIDLTKNADKIVSKYQIWNLPLNTRYIDMSPAYLGENLVFASSGNILSNKKAISGFNNQPFLELYTGLLNGSMDSITTFSKKINTKYHEGPVCFSKDGQTMYITRNNFLGITFKQQEAKVNNLKIFIAKWNGKDWGDITEFPYNSDKYSVGHAALSQDEQTLYFSSNMPGGFGGTDIYYSKLVNGEWEKPVNLGSTINTEGKEMFPYVDSNGVLYFSSNGIPGFGGLDIFAAYPNNDSSFQIENLGTPLNSSYDDFGYIKNDFDCTGFFTSNRPGGKGYDDIYGFKIDAADLSIRCSNAKTLQLLPYTTVVLKSEEGELITSNISDEDGLVHFFVEPCRNYVVTAQKENYLSDSKKVSFYVGSIELTQDLELKLEKIIPELNISIVDKSTGMLIAGATLDYTIAGIKRNMQCKEGTASLDLMPGTGYELFAISTGYFGNELKIFSETNITSSTPLVIKLDKIEVGKKVVLDNIYYDLNKWDIRADAALELDKVTRVLTYNPDLRVELSSHTDCRASEAYNLTLSQQRAESAVKYLVKQGINKHRLVAKGYGESQLLNKCADGVSCTEEEHQMNRRTELKVLKK